MIMGSKQDKLEDIVHDMEKHISSELKVAIKNNFTGKQKRMDDLDVWKGGKINGNNKDWQL